MFEIARRCFNLSDKFISKFKHKQPQWGPIGYFTYKRTYARELKNGRTEEYWETCQRVVEGTISIQKNYCKSHGLPWVEKKAKKTAEKMFSLMWDFKFLPPGRGLWAMGTEQLLKNGSTALLNCAFISTKDIEQDPSLPFCFLMDVSMLGVGCGFDTRGADKTLIYNPKGKINFTIPDTREGWVQSVQLLIEAYLKPGSPLPVFDYSKIRSAGAKIKGFGGIASGPGPLKDFHEYVVSHIFEDSIGELLTSVQIVDVMNLIGKVVVSGNSRRSSEIALGCSGDVDFINMKQDQDLLLHHRWASNNSINCIVGMDYSTEVQSTIMNGEPGYFWLNNAQAYGRMGDVPNWKDRNALGCNPCSEQTLEHAELCNLVETFPARHESLEEYLETLKIAYLYAKTVTLLPTVWDISNAIMIRNRRIGLSQSGITRAFKKHGRRKMLQWCDEGYKFVESLDIQYSGWLGIPCSIKRTSVKPSGTVSLLPGEPPGIHYPHSEYYIRRIRVSIFSPLVDPMKKAGYHIEPEIGKEDSSLVISFPIYEKHFEKGKNDVSIWEQAHNAIAYQRHWADNQVSVTVTFKEHEANNIIHILEMCEDSLKSISFLPLTDHGYVQAPYESIDRKQYNEMKKNIKPVNFNQVSELTHEHEFCDSERCEL